MTPTPCSIPFPGDDQWRDLAVVLTPAAEGPLAEGDARLLGVARSLADQFGCYVWAIATTRDSEASAKGAIAAGADAVEVQDDDDSDTLTERLAAFATSRRPEAVLAAPDPALHAAMARVAERLRAPFAASGIALVEDASSRTLAVRTPRFGGRLLLDFTSVSARPFFITVDPTALPPPFPNPDREGEIVAAEARKTSTTRPAGRQN